MSWTIIASICQIMAAIAIVGGGFFVAGELRQITRQNSDLLVAHEKQLKDHGNKLADHDMQLARVEEWKSAFQSGQRHPLHDQS